jgi:hypothetical protein
MVLTVFKMDRRSSRLSMLSNRTWVRSFHVRGSLTLSVESVLRMIECYDDQLLNHSKFFFYLVDDHISINKNVVEIVQKSSFVLNVSSLI